MSTSLLKPPEENLFSASLEEGWLLSLPVRLKTTAHLCVDVQGKGLLLQSSREKEAEGKAFL